MLCIRAGRRLSCVAHFSVRFFLILAVAVFLRAGPVTAIEARAPVMYHAAVVNGSVTGSAFSISDGIAVTNAHVVGGRGPGEQIYLLLPGQPRVAARILAVSRRIDLAVLAVSDGVLPVTPRGPARDGPGQAIYAVGVVAASGAPRRQVTASGTVSSAMRTVRPFGRGVIARMPGVRRGFSGGPVFDRRGQLVGMVAALRPGSAGNPSDREAFILSADDVRREVARLLRRADVWPAGADR
ncbi:serine protease [uncultured Roseobacter sp.]|uniref:S1 family peptidase n=1 Tax=uncultured Roseobacter sp. TaxID=114847 RepID=UPI00261876FF|nr:serine protease [uncultured Roseobacter sp.]